MRLRSRAVAEPSPVAKKASPVKPKKAPKRAAEPKAQKTKKVPKSEPEPKLELEPELEPEQEQEQCSDPKQEPELKPEQEQKQDSQETPHSEVDDSPPSAYEEASEQIEESTPDVEMVEAPECGKENKEDDEGSHDDNDDDQQDEYDDEDSESDIVDGEEEEDEAEIPMVDALESNAEDSDELEVDMIVESNGRIQQRSKQTDESQQVTRLKSAKEFRSHRLPLTCVCVDTNDKYVYTASKDGSIIKWCLKTRKILKKVNSIRRKEAEANKKLAERFHVNHINAIAISDDSKFLATGGWDKSVRIWSPETLEWMHTFTLHRQEVTALAFRRGHHMLYSGSADRSVMLWTLEDDDNRCFVESLIGHESAITSMDTTRKERVLTSGGRDQSIRIWKIVEQAQTVFQSKHQSADVTKFINDQVFVSGGEDGNINLWTTMKRSPLFTIKAHDSDKKSNLSYWVTSLATFYTKPAKQTFGDKNPHKRRKLDDGDHNRRKHGNDEEDNSSGDDDEKGSDDENITSFQLAQGDNAEALVASGSCDSKLHIWKLIKNSLELHQTIECPGYINDLRFTSDGKRVIAACGKEHKFGRWTVAKGVKNCWRVFEVNKD